MKADARMGGDLAAAVEVLGSGGLAIEGVHVYLSGLTPLERHWVADIRRDIFSASKTFTSVAIGIAQAEGLLGGCRGDHDPTPAHDVVRDRLPVGRR